MVKPLTDLERRMAAARLLIDVKIQEHAAHALAGRRELADQARHEASAQLEVCLDLYERSFRENLEREL